MATVTVQWLHIALVVNTFISAVPPLDVVSTGRNAGINWAIADEELADLPDKS
jgi:hypothetical protein